MLNITSLVPEGGRGGGGLVGQLVGNCLLWLVVELAKGGSIIKEAIPSSNYLFSLLK